MADEHKNRQKQRLQAALRANLKRRKAQIRARAMTQTVAEKSLDSAGIAQNNETR